MSEQEFKNFKVTIYIKTLIQLLGLATALLISIWQARGFVDEIKTSIQVDRIYLENKINSVSNKEEHHYLELSNKNGVYDKQIDALFKKVFYHYNVDEYGRRY